MRYKLKYDLHTHTVFSHGKGQIEDNVRAGIAKGLKAIGISERHGRHPTADTGCGNHRRSGQIGRAHV